MSNNEKQEENQQEEQTSHHFDRLMFGSKRVPSKLAEKNPSSSTSSKTEQFDMMSMIQSVDQLMGSVNKFKPMVKQLAPLFDLFKTKK